jgi:hypothetical protein
MWMPTSNAGNWRASSTVADAHNCAGAWRTNQLRLTRGGCAARQEPGRRRSRLGRLEGQGDAEIDPGGPRSLFAAVDAGAGPGSSRHGRGRASRRRRHSAKPTRRQSGHDTYISVSTRRSSRQLRPHHTAPSPLCHPTGTSGRAHLWPHDVLDPSCAAVVGDILLRRR